MRFASPSLDTHVGTGYNSVAQLVVGTILGGGRMQADAMPSPHLSLRRRSLSLLAIIAVSVFLNACANAAPPKPTAPVAPAITSTPTSTRLAVTIGDYSGSFDSGQNSVYEAIDGDVNTGWTSVHKAVGEYFELRLDGPHVITQLHFYFLPPQGSRMRELQLIFADGSTQELTLLDESGWQTVPVTGPPTDRLRLVIKSVTDPVRFSSVYLPEVELHGYAAP